jgi:hypothetical protein
MLLHTYWDLELKVSSKFFEFLNIHIWLTPFYHDTSLSMMFKSTIMTGPAGHGVNAIINNVSVTSWQLVLLVEETGIPGENFRLAAGPRQTLSHNVVSSTPRLERDSNSQR